MRVTFTVTAAPTLTSLTADERTGRHRRHDRGHQFRRDAGHQHGQVQRDGGDADELVGDEHRGPGPGGRDDGQRGGHGRRPRQQWLTFTVTVAPTLTSLSPTSGPVGTAVTITGTNFGATRGTQHGDVQRHGGDADDLVGDEHRGAGADGATTGNVVVTVGGLASNGVAFTVTVAPDA